MLARDDETGRIGTYLSQVRHSEPEQGDAADPDQLRGAEQPARGPAATRCSRPARTRSRSANPLVQDGQKLIPSVTRVFSKSRDMYVYLQAYEPDGRRPASRWSRSDASTAASEKAFETRPVAVTERLNNRLEDRAAQVQHWPGQARRPADTTAR